MQEWKVPNTAPQKFLSFSQCSLTELENFLKRKTMERCTVDTLISDLQGHPYKPGRDVGAWFDERQHEFRQMKGQVSEREFKNYIAEMLPDGDALHEELAAMADKPKSLQAIRWRSCPKRPRCRT